MRYIPNTEQDRRQMLEAIGVGSVDELFADVPDALRLQAAAQDPAGPGGGGAGEAAAGRWQPGTPTRIGTTASWERAATTTSARPSSATSCLRGEFLTAYTPYQPEISQGTLQALFEYQTLVCQLTGMEVSNASMYEGASATAEAILMAHRITGRTEVVVARAVHPEYRQVARTYAAQVGLVFREIAVHRGRCDRPGRGDARARAPDRLPGGAVSQLLRRRRGPRPAGRGRPRRRGALAWCAWPSRSPWAS